MPLIGQKLQSMLSQNVPPEKIYVNLPDVFKRNNQPYPDIPTDFLTRFGERVIWNRCGEDLGPVTKLQGALDATNETDDIWIITIDDDISYLPYTIEVYERMIMITPHEKHAFGLSGFKWINGSIVMSMQIELANVLEGYASACYHRSFFKKTWTTYLSKCLESRDCALSDDVTVSNWLSLNNVKRVNVNIPWVNRQMMWSNHCILSYGNDSDALHCGANGDSTTNNNVVRYVRVKEHLDKIRLLSKEFK